MIHTLSQLLTTALLCSLMVVGGCHKKTNINVVALDTPEKLAEEALESVNQREYEIAENLLKMMIDRYPDATDMSSYQILLADVLYEQNKFAEAAEAYQYFMDYYPSDDRVEYAHYKAAYAHFKKAQASHINCDSTAIEKAKELCDSYLSRIRYTAYRPQIEDLLDACIRRIIDKELYIANTNIMNGKFVAAQKRLTEIQERYNLARYGSADKFLYYQAKLAYKAGDSKECSELITALHEAHPQSQFTAMADRLSGFTGFLQVG